jgi:hypothetical protein
VYTPCEHCALKMTRGAATLRPTYELVSNAIGYEERRPLPQPRGVTAIGAARHGVRAQAPRLGDSRRTACGLSSGDITTASGISDQTSSAFFSQVLRIGFSLPRCDKYVAVSLESKGCAKI